MLHQQCLLAKRNWGNASRLGFKSINSATSSTGPLTLLNLNICSHFSLKLLLRAPVTCDWSVSFGGTCNRIHFRRVLDMNKAHLPENRLSVNVLYYMDLLILLSFSLSFYHRFEGCTVVRQKRGWTWKERRGPSRLQNMK